MNKIKISFFEQVISNHRGMLVAALLRMLPEAEVEEVVQEACLRVWQKLDDLENDAIKPFWFRVARNLAIDKLRHQKVHDEYLCQQLLTKHETLQVIDGDNYQSFKMHEMLAVAVNSLPPVCRNVLVYRKIHGYSQTEIATMMGISVNTVENHLVRGMKSCREFFLANCGDIPRIAKVLDIAIKA
jgi:RNA polymerase sigma-70 factor (ECF subfamily)